MQMCSGLPSCTASPSSYGDGTQAVIVQGTLQVGRTGSTIQESIEMGSPKTMDRDTFDTTIRTFKHRTPFRPFSVAMVNGDRLEVDHPDALAVRDGVALFAGRGGVPVVFDHEGVSQVIGDLVERPSA